MLRQVEKLRKKNGDDDSVRIREVSNIEIGSEVYRNGELYGIVVGESDSLWHIRKGADSIPSPFGKERFENYLKEEYFYVQKPEPKVEAPVVKTKTRKKEESDKIG